MNGRRRALIAAQAESGIKLADVPVGEIVSFSAGGTHFINVGVVGGASLLLRATTLGTQRAMGKSNDLYDYDGSSMDVYLTGTFYNQYDATIQNKMVNVSVTYGASDGNDVINKTIERKIFLPTRAQLSKNGDVDGVVLAALKIFNETDTVSTARKALRGTTTSYATWWTMDAYSTSRYFTIGESGAASQAAYNGGGIYPRPMIAMDSNVTVELEDGVYVCQF